jgi:hypothetical protein
MPFAVRYFPDEVLIAALVLDVAHLSKRHPEGFIIRLHVLGDFFSVEYVAVWVDLLDLFPVRIFGYTHWPHDTEIGKAITEMVHAYPGRCSILRSDKACKDDPLPGAYSVMKGQEPPEGALVCPEQTGKTESCMTCGLCMHGRIEVAFLQH